MPYKNPKATKITVAELDVRKAKLLEAGYPESKWIVFCRHFLTDPAISVLGYYSKSSKSKYIYVGIPGGLYFKVRFSEHPPSRERPDCDLFVGRSHLGCINTDQAIQKVTEFLSDAVVESNEQSIGQ